MKKHNVEYSLYKILKNKKEDEIYYTILNMVNKTYNYEIEYLNKVDYDELMLYLEKIIIIGSGMHKVENEEELIHAIMLFANNKDKLRFRQNIRGNHLLNIKYAAKIKAIPLKKNANAIKITSLFLAVIIFLGMYGKELKAGELDESYEILKDYSIEMNIDDKKINTEEMLSYNFERKRVNNEIEIKEPTNEEKITYILEKYNLTEEEFNVVCAIAMTESKPNSYDDAYCVINTIYNRTLSKLWHIDIEKVFGEDTGYSLFYQAIAPTQFVVYEEGRYLQYLGVREGACFQAVIDFLYTKNIKHDFLSFRASNCDVKGSVQFVPDGNKYFNSLALEDRISNYKTR